MASSDSTHGSDRGSAPRVGVAPPADPALPDLNRLLADVERQIAAERGPRAYLRSRSTSARVAIAGCGVLAIALAITLGALRPDHAVYPLERMLAVLLFLALLIIADVVLALWPLQRAPLPRWLHVTGVTGALLGLCVVYALPAAHEAHPASSHAAGVGPLLEGVARCLGIGSLLALAVYALMRALDRGGKGRALLAAAASGFAANFGLQLHCPLTMPVHMLLGHLGLAVLFVSAVAVVSRMRGQ